MTLDLVRRNRPRFRLTHLVVVGGPVVDFVLTVHEVHCTVVVVVVVSISRSVDRQHEVVSSNSIPLCVCVGEQTGLQQFVLRIRDSWDHEGGAEGNLFVLQELVVNVLVENDATNFHQGPPVLRPDLGSVQRVKLIVVLGSRVHRLDVELPLWEVALIDVLDEVVRSVAEVLASDWNGLIIHHVHLAARRKPVELHVRFFALLVEHLEGVDAGSPHVAVILGNAQVVEQKGKHVSRLWVV
mmetsp:Transcript_6285/g.18968  ORF Transcript_6285/g.18968 Transcript_6285/m.18968 type:complete len:240 (+) Transcript_6285:317-1036(+)